MAEPQNLQVETTFFHDIAAKVRNLVESYENAPSVAQYKQSAGDYATEADIAVEKLIVSEIARLFPGDAVMAEEEHADAVIPDGRIWIIDPICGTSNLGRGLTIFCTNIALADHGEVIASCVIDHSQPDYFWSVGNNQVYVNDTEFKPQAVDERFGAVIDTDFGAVTNVSDEEKQAYSQTICTLACEPGYMIQSLNTSLGFAYCAVGKMSGFISIYNHPWDIAASAFLIQQSGGIISDLTGGPWSLQSVGAIGSHSASIHQKIVQAHTARRV